MHPSSSLPSAAQRLCVIVFRGLLYIRKTPDAYASGVHLRQRCYTLAEGLLVAGAVVVGLVAAAIVHQDNHFAVVHDAFVAVRAGVIRGTTALVT